MRRWILLLTCLLPLGAQAQSTAQQDSLLDGYFAILDNNANVNADTIAKLYAPRVIYYGHAMGRDALLADKLAFVHRWPDRHYDVAPGSASRVCSADGNRCELAAVLRWTRTGSHGTEHGRSRIRLTLARESGSLKIVRESAVTLG